MAVPKRKTSRARRDSRSSGKGMKVKAICLCSNCNAPLATHQACPECGFYKGSKVLRTKSDRKAKRTELKDVMDARKKAKEEAEQNDTIEAEVEEAKTPKK